MSTPTFTPGHELAERYVIEELLGIGRTAEVYLARDLSLGRACVVKVLSPALAEHAEVRHAFRDQIVRAATLSHPHVARVYDGGQEHGAIFMVTEYLSGGSLADAFDAGLVLNVDEAARLGRDVASGLAALHDAGFVHGNLAPSKLLFDAEGHVRISDVALAGLGDGYRDAFSLNDARYISPEQATGEVPTPKSDVYALALILFEAVTGAPAFEGTNIDAVLRARIDASLPVRSDLGTLDMILAQAAVSVPEYRLDAETLTGRLGAVVSDSSDFVLPVDLSTSGGPAPILSQFQPSEARTTIGFRAPSFGDVANATQAVPTVSRSGEAPRPVRSIDTFDPTVSERNDSFQRLSQASYDRPPKRRLGFLVAAIVIILGAVGAGAAWKLGLFTQSYTVPSLIGLDTTHAASLTKGDGLTIQVTGHTSSSSIGVNDIVSQSIAAGTSMKGAGSISVTLSTGPQMVTLPTNLLGEDCVSATAQLVKLHIGAQCPSSAAVVSATVPAGRIAKIVYQGTTNPVAVPANATVVLALSSGATGTTATGTTGTSSTSTSTSGATTTTTAATSAGTSTVPNLVGMNYAEVIAALSKADYYFRTEGSGAGTTTWTNVTAQSPVAGTALAKKKTITLTVTGASAVTTTTTKSTSVTTTTTKVSASTAGEALPNFVGMTRSQVFAAMAKLKLYFTTHGPGAGTNAWQVVVSQSPAANTVVKPLSSVSLNVKQ